MYEEEEQEEEEEHCVSLSAMVFRLVCHNHEIQVPSM